MPALREREIEIQGRFTGDDALRWTTALARARGLRAHITGVSGRVTRMYSKIKLIDP